MKILLEGKMEHDSLGRTSGKFPGRTKHPQLGTRLLGWGGGGGGGGGREKTGKKRKKMGGGGGGGGGGGKVGGREWKKPGQTG